MFVVKEKVVYPGHGVAQIDRIVEKTIGGSPTTFFELRLINKDMTVLIPTTNLGMAGIRPLSTQANVKSVLKLLAMKPVREVCSEMLSNWNKRNKDYQCRLRSGDIVEICKIYRDLKCIEREKELSFGERLLLTQTEHLLAEEISFVSNLGEDMAIQKIRSYFE
ncbi:MAG: CarD family transcriptional regulator [Candidatus Babeliales bacterium]